MSGIYQLPPILSGSTENQLRQLRDYLVRMARQEQSAGQAVSTPLPSAGTAGASGAAGSTAALETVEDARKRAAALKALIVKTADRQAEDKAELKSAIESVEGTTLLHIDSSRGTVFKHSAVETRLTVVLYRGGERITDKAGLRAAFGNSAYLQWSWQRMNDDRYGLISNSDSRLSDDGFTLTLNPEDVDTKVTFACQLVVE